MTDMALRHVERDIAIQTALDKFKAIFTSQLQLLRRDPSTYGDLTPSRLLLLREQCLHEAGLPDIFAVSKQQENNAALQALPALLMRLEATSPEDLLQQVIYGVLAGNMFDWGAQPILDLVQQQSLTFQSARDRIQIAEKYNHLDGLRKVLASKTYKKAMVFVDNSGADCILGILPFVKFLLTKGTKVVLSANSKPAVNDITASELKQVMDRVVHLDKVLGSAWTERRIEVVANGNSAPCIDLRRVSQDCAQACADVDLVVLEGMGRAVHTNFTSRFKCDVLKVAVIKNERLSNWVGCKLYDGVVLFQQSQTS
jgi:type II pantothenate kinase